SLKTQKDDIFYIFSDGFADQFGGEMNQKYMSKKFRKLLLEISALSLNEQKLVLENEFADWKGKNKQTDDILVMGIKI
ncbi:MAG: histidine kinase, partial [Bacteroidetes bacterium]